METVVGTTRLFGRVGWAALAVGTGAGLWQVAAAGGAVLAAGLAAAALPDVALLYGMAPGLIRGQLHPRAVTAYNALHDLAGPLAVFAGAAASGSTLLLAVGLGWTLHVAVDRSVGYGLRTPEGFQRG